MLSGEINIKTLKIKSLFNEVNDEEHIINEIEGNFFIAADGRKITFDWLNIPNRVVVMEQKEDLKPILEKTKSESEKRDEKARELANEHNLPYQIVTTIPKKELFIGKKCTYAVKYLENTNFYKSKCKISKELAKVFEKIASE